MSCFESNSIRHGWLVGLLVCLLVVPAAESGDKLRFGILSPAKPTRTYTDWTPSADYLSQRLGMPVELVIPKGMEQVREFAESGAMDVFYVNAYVFYRLQEAGLARPLAQMRNLHGNTTSHGTFIVRADGPIQSLAQLQGKTIALISPLGAGSYLAPRALLNQHGLQIEQDLNIVYTQDLARAAYMVMLGEADAAVMCAVNYALVERKVTLGEMRHIAKTAVFPESVVAARKGLDPALAERVRDAMVSMQGDEAKAVLSALEDMKVQDFVPYDPSTEALTRELIEEGRF